MAAIRVAVRAPGAASCEAIEALLRGREGLELVPPGPAVRFDVLVVVGEPGEAPDGPQPGGPGGVIFLSDDPGTASWLAAADLRAWGLLDPGAGPAAAPGRSRSSDRKSHNLS